MVGAWDKRGQTLPELKNWNSLLEDDNYRGQNIGSSRMGRMGELVWHKKVAASTRQRGG